MAQALSVVDTSVLVLEPRPGVEGATRKTATGVWLRAVPKPGAAKPAPSIMTPAAKQPDLFTWAKANPEKVGTTRELDPWEALAALPMPKPLPPKGTQLKLFGDELEGGAS